MTTQWVRERCLSNWKNLSWLNEIQYFPSRVAAQVFCVWWRLLAWDGNDGDIGAQSIGYWWIWIWIVASSHPSPSSIHFKFFSSCSCFLTIVSSTNPRYLGRPRFSPDPSLTSKEHLITLCCFSSLLFRQPWESSRLPDKLRSDSECPIFCQHLKWKTWNNTHEKSWNPRNYRLFFSVERFLPFLHCKVPLHKTKIYRKRSER